MIRISSIQEATFAASGADMRRDGAGGHPHGKDRCTLKTMAVDPTTSHQRLHERLQQLKELIPELERQAEELSQSRHLQAALFEISELAYSSKSMHQFYTELHDVIRTLMYADNLLVAVIEPVSGDIRFQYFFDAAEPDVTVEEINAESQETLRSGLTYFVIKGGKMVHVDRAAVSKLEEENVHSLGSLAFDWLGIPLQDGAHTFGALVVQSHDESISFSAEDERILGFVCRHISAALQRKWSAEALARAKDRLEERVAKRTEELSDAVADLEREIAVRRRRGLIQRTLFEIGRLATERTDMHSFYASIHKAINGLIEAPNCYVALVDAEAKMLRYPYIVDQSEPSWPDEPLGDLNEAAGPTVHVLRTRKASLFRDQDRDVPSGFKGVPAVAWVGAPLIYHEEVIGVIAVQSYEENVNYAQEDVELLTFVGQHVASAIKHQHDQMAIERAREELERRVEGRTRDLQLANTELRGTLDKLRSTQSQLLQSEKLASLGGLVAGVAHEINTPIGVALTATSHLHDQAKKADGDDPAAAAAQRTLSFILDNLARAAKLVNNFKQIAADQTSGQRRRFELHSQLDASLSSLHPMIRKAGHEIELRCPPNIIIDGFPSSMHQVVANLVSNSLTHGFVNGPGRIEINARALDQTAVIEYRDDGIGVSEDVRDHMFEPFYTTSRGAGSSGLGMHIVYNRIAQMGGAIELDSRSGSGVAITMTIPRTAPETAAVAPEVSVP